MSEEWRCITISVTIVLKDKYLKITDGVIERINNYKQMYSDDTEAGGILVARENIDTNNIVVEYVTEPYIGDKRSRTRFIRKDKKHIELFHNLHMENSGIYAYIGEWHTHPEKSPKYSKMDYINWRKIAQSNTSNMQSYYHIIVGTEEISVWEYVTKDKKCFKIL